MEDSKLDPADLIVKSKVKTLIKEAGMNASAEIWTELGHVVTKKVKSAIRRAQANGRKTVKATDV
jgi:histone H3/H4